MRKATCSSELSFRTFSALLMGAVDTLDERAAYGRKPAADSPIVRFDHLIRPNAAVMLCTGTIPQQTVPQFLEERIAPLEFLLNRSLIGLHRLISREIVFPTQQAAAGRGRSDANTGEEQAR